MKMYERSNHSGPTEAGSGGGASKTYAHGPDSRPSTTRPWHGGREELRRKKRIAKYKLYAVEGKVKDSCRKGLSWMKRTCSKIVHGF
ncbi:UNVERIFIED_CONTAM: hypothetical protein Slati_0812700 [Sesamum latifolium]|uniref:Uncharacterized protein n=1 Tax=Sesamum latifolium TaxID=2727402 RepID=A0AAW2XL62_9LAMI